MSHAILSPSGAHRWTRCLGAPLMEKDYRDHDTEASTTGTYAHDIAAQCLTRGVDAESFVGMKSETGIEFTEDMAEDVQQYVDFCRSLGGHMMVEVEVPIDHITGEKDAKGTSDCIVIRGSTLIVVDYKNGYSPVYAEDNEQMLMYAAGALHALDDLEDFTDIEMHIIQPNHSEGVTHSEWKISIEALQKYAETISLRAFDCDAMLSGAAEPELTPGPKQCHWCKAKDYGACPAYNAYVEETMDVQFEDLTEDAVDAAVGRAVDDKSIGQRYDKLAMIKRWVTAMEGAVFRLLAEGQEVVGADGPYKLVLGRRGRAKWRDEQQAIDMMKNSMRLKVDTIFDKKVISPTKAEKLSKGKAAQMSKAQWEKLNELVHRPSGKPSVAPASSPKPAVDVKAVEFDAVEEDVDTEE